MAHLPGDARTAADARQFLLGWLQRFPQYASRDFYISGESYGGHYVPNLALEIWNGNQQLLVGEMAGGGGPQKKGLYDEQHINLKGFLVGNAWTDAAIDNKGELWSLWSLSAHFEVVFYLSNF